MYQQGFGDYTNIVGTENGTGKQLLPDNIAYNIAYNIVYNIV